MQCFTRQIFKDRFSNTKMKSVPIQDVKEFEKGNNLLLEVEDAFIIQMVYLAVHEYSDCDCGNLETHVLQLHCILIFCSHH